MRKAKNPSMMARYVRCNHSPNQFCLLDWTANQADVLWVALLLDHLPSKLITKSNIFASKGILHSNDFGERYFLLHVPPKELLEYEYLKTSPFWSSSGLQDLKVKFRGNWRNLSFKFEFPEKVKPMLSLKGGGEW